MSHALIKPTRGEALVLNRRRKWLNQIAAAATFKVHPDVYRDWEADKRLHDQPSTRRLLGRIQTHEHCYLLRRRAKLTQREIARRMGVTRLWVIQMETGEAPVDRLSAFWGV